MLFQRGFVMIASSTLPTIIAAFFTSSLLIMAISYMVYKHRDDKRKGMDKYVTSFHIKFIRYLLLTLIPFVIIFNVAFVLQEVLLKDRTSVRIITTIAAFTIGWIISWYFGKKYSIKMEEYSEY